MEQLQTALRKYMIHCKSSFAFDYEYYVRLSGR